MIQKSVDMKQKGVRNLKKLSYKEVKVYLGKTIFPLVLLDLIASYTLYNIYWPLMSKLS